jgi:hypothetical protein
MKKLLSISVALTVLLLSCVENPFLASFKEDDDYRAGITVTACYPERASEAVPGDDGALIIKPADEADGGKTCVLLSLANKHNFDAELYLFDNGPVKNRTVRFKQRSPNLLELIIEGAVVGDAFNYTLQMRDLNGPNKTNRYTLPTIRCLSFDTALEKVLADNGTVAYGARVGADATILVPSDISEAAITGIPRNVNAGLRGGVVLQDLAMGVARSVLLTVIAQNQVTTELYRLSVVRGSFDIAFDNGEIVVTFSPPPDYPHDELVQPVESLSWAANTLLTMTINGDAGVYAYQWWLDGVLLSGDAATFSCRAQDFGRGWHQLTMKLITAGGETYSSKTVEFNVA